MKLVRVKFKLGERYSLLVDKNGMPLWYPTLFATSQLRNPAKTPNTIEAYLNAIKVLLNWANAESLILEKMFSKKKFLSVNQIELLCNEVKKKKPTDLVKSSSKIIDFTKKRERVRRRLSAVETVSNKTLYIRLTFIAQYVDWLAKHVLNEQQRIIDIETSNGIKRMVEAIRIRRPLRGGDQLRFREGLNESQRSLLLDLISPENSENPFSEKTKNRDYLILKILYYTGMRQSELLSIRIHDFNFQNNTLRIPRRHDDVKDPRIKQPVVKTLERIIPLNSKLVKEIHEYIVGERGGIANAKKNKFLLITYKEGPYCGMPLSQSGLEHIFKRVRKSSELLHELTPHLLRHTWNDRFSELCDRNRTSTADEEKMRSYLMGWREGSGTSSVYTRRFVVKKAHEASLLLQQRIDKNEK